MFELLRAGGYIMLPLLIMWIITFAIIAERFWTLRQRSVLPPALLPQVVQYAKTHKLDINQLRELEENSPLGSVLATVLANRHRSRDIIRQKVEDSGRRVVHELHRFLNTLGTIAIISPLMGLLGTVFGLIKMFFVITSAGIGDAQRMAGGIGEALVATAAGLVVAITAYIFHRFLRGKIQNLAIELEREASDLIDALEQSNTVSTGTTGTPAARTPAPAGARA